MFSRRSFLSFSDLSKKFKSVHVVLVEETLKIYRTKPESREEKSAPLEVIDLNEHRRQANVTCEKIPRDIFESQLQWSDMVNLFAVKVSSDAASSPSRYATPLFAGGGGVLCIGISRPIFPNECVNFSVSHLVGRGFSVPRMSWQSPTGPRLLVIS